jgi:hypothetical protein
MLNIQIATVVGNMAARSAVHVIGSSHGDWVKGLALAIIDITFLGKWRIPWQSSEALNSAPNNASLSRY